MKPKNNQFIKYLKEISTKNNLNNETKKNEYQDLIKSFKKEIDLNSDLIDKLKDNSEFIFKTNFSNEMEVINTHLIQLPLYSVLLLKSNDNYKNNLNIILDYLKEYQKENEYLITQFLLSIMLKVDSIIEIDVIKIILNQQFLKKYLSKPIAYLNKITFIDFIILTDYYDKKVLETIFNNYVFYNIFNNVYKIYNKDEYPITFNEFKNKENENYIELKSKFVNQIISCNNFTKKISFNFFKELIENNKFKKLNEYEFNRFLENKSLDECRYSNLIELVELESNKENVIKEFLYQDKKNYIFLPDLICCPNTYYNYFINENVSNKNLFIMDNFGECSSFVIDNLLKNKSIFSEIDSFFYYQNDKEKTYIKYFLTYVFILILNKHLNSLNVTSNQLLELYNLIKNHFNENEFDLSLNEFILNLEIRNNNKDLLIDLYKKYDVNLIKNNIKYLKNL